MEAGEAAELPTAHISNLQRARWCHAGGLGFAYRTSHDFPTHLPVFLSCFRTRPCMCTCGPEARLHCQDLLDPSSNPVWGKTDHKEYFFFSLLESKSDFLFQSRANRFAVSGQILVVLSCAMLYSCSPRTFMWMLQQKRCRPGRPVTGRVRDGDADPALSKVLLWGGKREKRDAQSRRTAPASVCKKVYP